MARKKKSIELEDIVSKDFIVEAKYIEPVKQDPNREKVLDWRAKGFNDNQIASMLKLHKHVVENIK